MVEMNSTIEQEIAQLEQQIAEKRSALEQEKAGPELPSEKETLREVIGEKIQQSAPQYQPAPPVQSPPAKPKQDLSAQTDDTTLSYVLPELKDKVQELVNLVFNKSLDEGIKEAAKSNDAALIDAFHDVLVDELYNTLLERKKLEKV